VDRFRIIGPTRIQGTVSAAGAKNAALPALAASLLTEETIELSNLPRVRDIRTMQALLQHLGVEVSDHEGTAQLRPGSPIQTDDAPYELVKTMRASVLVLGPLVARLGHAEFLCLVAVLLVCARSTNTWQDSRLWAPMCDWSTATSLLGATVSQEGDTVSRFPPSPARRTS